MKNELITIYQTTKRHGLDPYIHAGKVFVGAPGNTSIEITKQTNLIKLRKNTLMCLENARKEKP